MDKHNSELRSELYDKTRGLVDCESVLDELEKEIRQQGFAGPADIPKLIFLTFYTSMLKKPVSLVVKGPSSSGKSFSLNTAIQFIPETAYERFEGMSEKAIIYLKDLNLKHKHLVIGEAAGMADGNGRTLLRQLLSEGQVRYATVQNTSDGLKGSELPPLQGPTGLIMTTTANKLHPEDETRMLSINIPESSEQIAASLMAQALGYERKKPADVERWHNFFEFTRLANPDVYIPYAPEIAKRLPWSYDRIQRDFAQVLSLIKAHALMHECHRKTWEARIEANEADYEAVRALVNGPISQGLEVSVPDPIMKVVEVVQQLQLPEPYDEGVSVTKLSQLLDRDPSAVSRTVSKAIGQGFLKNQNPGQGREARLIVGERQIPSGSVLPPAEEIFRKTSEVAYAD